jgi:hypothetical protein
MGPLIRRFRQLVRDHSNQFIDSSIKVVPNCAHHGIDGGVKELVMCGATVVIPEKVPQDRGTKSCSQRSIFESSKKSTRATL